MGIDINSTPKDSKITLTGNWVKLLVKKKSD